MYECVGPEESVKMGVMDLGLFGAERVSLCPSLDKAVLGASPNDRHTTFPLHSKVPESLAVELCGSGRESKL